MSKLIDFSKYWKGGRNMLQKKRIIEIEEKAENILKDLDLNDEIPVNPLLVASLEDISVYKVDFNSEDVSGIIRKSEDGVRVYIKDGEYLPRQRFTLAHELGHFYLHLKDGDGNFVDSNKTLNRGTLDSLDNEELEANCFAAALLMPSKVVAELYNKGYSERKIADLLNVSLPALKKRIVTLKEIGVIDE